MRKPQVVALEEHFSHPELLAGTPMKPIGEALLDLGERRLHEMDEAGIDLQVISHFPSGPQNLTPVKAADMSRATNDLIAETVARHPTRFAGFASLPLTSPDEAVKELGSMTYGSMTCDTVFFTLGSYHLWLDPRRLHKWNRIGTNGEPQRATVSRVGAISSLG